MAAPELRLVKNDTFWLLLLDHSLAMRPLPDQRHDRADHDLEQQGREQPEQVKNGEGEQLAVGAQRLAALAELPGDTPGNAALGAAALRAIAERVQGDSQKRLAALACPLYTLPELDRQTPALSGPALVERLSDALLGG